jgi:aldehyde dehydrogenase (NAD+)
MIDVAGRSIDDRSDVVDYIEQTFETGVTKPIAWRKHQLNQLIRMFEEQRPAIMAALTFDLKQTPFTAEIAEFDGVIKDAKFSIDHLDEWTKLESRGVPLPLLPGKGMHFFYVAFSSDDELLPIPK